MHELHSPRVQAKRRCIHMQSLRVAQLLIRQISGIPAHGKAEVPEMNADLIRAPRERTRLQQRRAVRVATSNAKLRARLETRFHIHGARTKLPGLRADRRIASEAVL